MASNSIGRIFRLTTFGESHGPAIGGVVDGMPAGIAVDTDQIQRELDRRRPGQSALTTARAEADRVELLSGVMDGVSTGTPIGFVIRNTDQHSSDYDNMLSVYRPSHADYTYDMKYGLRDHRGGGRSSARETASRVVGGALARMALRQAGISVGAYTEAVGAVSMAADPESVDLTLTDSNAVRCPDAETARRMIEEIERVRAEGDTVGCVIRGVVRGVPAGVGDPIYDKLQARLAAAMMSINAAKGFDYGMGFGGAALRGSETIDRFVADGRGGITTATNRSGGIQGGIANGQAITFRVAFKPIATLLRDVPTVDSEGRCTTLHARGRHDPCVAPRAVPVVEAMAAMTVLDALLMAKTTRL